MRRRPARTRPGFPITPWRLRVAGVAAGILVIAAAYGALRLSDHSLPANGFLYGLRGFREQVQLTLAGTPELRTTLCLRFAEDRVQDGDASVRVRDLAALTPLMRDVDGWARQAFTEGEGSRSAHAAAAAGVHALSDEEDQLGRRVAALGEPGAGTLGQALRQQGAQHRALADKYAKSPVQDG
ncbi:MAG: hypothetical protein ACYDAY_07650 [Candidatus Dormibacteria bacterium]